MRTLFILAFVAALSCLAPRPAADGNVTAHVDRKGVLVVLGDERDNRVVVGRTGIPNEFVVRGEVFTTVNGTNEVVLAANDVKIFMRGGDDEARVDGFVPGFVHVEGGSGNDRLSLGDPVVHGTALLDGGDGDDHLGMEGADANAGLRLIGGDGNDDVQLVFAIVRGKLVIDLGKGEDVLMVSNFAVAGSFRFEGGSGSDDVLLNDSTVSSDIVLALAAGDDEVVLERNFFGGRLKIGLGVQDDALTVTGTTVVGRAHFHGNSGRDTYTDSDDNDFQSGPPKVSGF